MITAKRVMPVLLAVCFGLSAGAVEREQDFNFGWKFKLQPGTNISARIPLDDSGWRTVRLPHDWSVEASFDSSLEGCTGYLPGGVAWYQKHFPTPGTLQNKKVFILFDGVYNHATFWVNGVPIGENPYGYSPVWFDITDKLSHDGSGNVLSVHVDHSRYADSRWYTGSGIYRNVKLIITDRLHIPIWGTFISTPRISADAATVRVNTRVVNERTRDCEFILSTVLMGPDGRCAASGKKKVRLAAGQETSVVQSLEVAHPDLWEPDAPNRYHAVSAILDHGGTVDEYTTSFGIRSLRFDQDQGFFLNGKPTYMKGVCLHHDGGLVGAAVPKGVWRRRLQLLKEAGCNAIRTAHNPPSEEFLDLCDEMGFLVQHEIFDEMDNPKDKRLNLNERSVDYITRGYHEEFQQWAESDLKRSILRDRNHPCIVEWSIGNEIEWTYPDYKSVSGLWDPDVKGGYWNRIPQLTAAEMKARYAALPDRKYKLTETAHKLAGWVKELDTTRPVTANLIIPVASLASGYADALDVVGVSYQTAQYDWCKANYPDKLITGSENSGSWQDWNSIIENPMVFSMFMWTGIDYLGEANGKWPRKGGHGDMLDFAGFKKPGWYLFRSIWVNEPQVVIMTRPLAGSKFILDELSGKPLPTAKKTPNWDTSGGNMHWNYAPGEKVLVEVGSNCPEVELLLNGRSLGRRTLSACPDRIMRWVVPFEAGTLTARAGFAGAETAAGLTTASEPVRIRLTTDKTTLSADGYDVAHIVAQLVDKDGNAVRTTEQRLTFDLDGEIRMLGVDNGSSRNTEDYQSNTVRTHRGRALLLVQSLRHGGRASVNVHAEGLPENQLHIEIEK